MKKTIKLKLFMCLILLVSALVFTACNNSNDSPVPDNSTTEPPTEDPHVHTEVIDSALPPTCTKTGLSEGKHCSVCGETILAQEVVSALGHTEVIDKAVEPTCSETGLTEGKHCSVCGETILAQEVVSALGHTEVIDEAVEPTCAKTGLTEGKHCSACGEILVEQEIISNDSIEHTYALVFTPPSAAEDGHIKDSCSVCGDVRSEEIVTATDFTLTRDNRDKVGYTGETGENLVIPAVFEENGTWYRVVGISSYAFLGCNNLISITIPESVTSIDSYAIYSCANLISFTIAENSRLTSIGSSAFFNCQNIESITIPFVGATIDGTSNTHFGYIFGANSYSYNNNYVPASLKTVVITGGTSIDTRAFFDCSGLTSITISNSVTRIGYQAFLSCNSLTSISIPFVGTTKDDASNTHFGYIFGAGSYSTHSTSIPTSLKTVVITGGTSIDTRAFSDCSGITSITIPDSITSIGYAAFSGCNNLTSVYINDIASWCAITFNSSSNPLYYAENLYLNGELVTDLVIPDSVTVISAQAFYGCKSLTGIRFTENSQLTSIGKYAFYDCSNLTSIVFSENSQLTDIGDSAFENCSNLTSIKIPGSVTSIGNRMLYGCSGLTTITFAENSQLTSIGDYAFGSCSSLTSITIPNNVTSIGNRAFENCTGLTSITIPFVGATKDGTSNTNLKYIFDSVPSSLKTVIVTNCTSIGTDAFGGCDGLTGITLPDSIISIGASAFSGCKSLTSITLPDSIISIESGAFSGCKSLTSITIPDSVTSIGASAFYNCSGLKSITFSKNSQLTSIGEKALYGCSSIESITIPFVGATKDGTENTHFGYIFGTPNFINNSTYVPYSLKDVVITGGTKISESAFYGCGNLTSITIPNSVTEIGYHAFRNCSDLTNITVSDSITNIGFAAFEGCATFKNIYITDLASWCAISFETFEANPLHCGGNLYLNDELITEMVIPDGVTAIPSHTFYGCKSIETVLIPDSVTGIGYSAFYDCTNLTSVTVPDSVTIIDNLAFSGCISLSSITIPCNVTSIGMGAFENCTSLTSITIPDSVTKLGGVVFKNCTGLTSIVIPDSVTSIGPGALSGCTGLTNISIPFVGSTKDDEKYTFFRYIFGACNYYDEEGSIPESLKTVVVTGGNEIAYGAFHYCDSLTSITLPDSITTIGAKAFNNCTGLTSIRIPSSVTSIGYSAFSDCTGLTDVTFDKNSELTSISHSVFYSCVGLTSITLPESLTSIEYDVFEGCVNMTSITLPFVGATKDGISNMHFGYIFGAPYSTDNAEYVPASLKTVVITNCTRIGDSAFKGCNNITSITIPESVTSIGSYAFYECTGLKDVHITNLASWCAIKFSSNYANPLHCADNLYLNGELVTDAVIPDGATTISFLAFYNYEHLTSISIPNSVTSIGQAAFENCTGLTNIVIPDSVTSINYGAFEGCENLTSITLPFVGENKDGSSNTNFGYIFGTSYYSSHGDYVPASLKTVVITGGTSIAAWAFRYCENIESITILDGVTSIGQYTFSRCTGLKNITLPDTLTSIGQYAFDGSTGFESITIPDSVTSIAIGIFQGCTGLTSITIPFVGTAEGSTDYPHLGYLFGTSSYYSNDAHVPASLKHVVITDSASIGPQAFYHCSNIESVRISNSVTEIGYYAFSGCTNLKSITFDGTVEQWNAISIGHSWKNDVPATEVVCSDGTVLL